MTRHLRRILIASAPALLITLLGCGGGDAPPPAPEVRITEDDPRWDCHTMGNRICGAPPHDALASTL